jgi:hypothetical protein
VVAGARCAAGHGNLHLLRRRQSSMRANGLRAGSRTSREVSRCEGVLHIQPTNPATSVGRHSTETWRLLQKTTVSYMEHLVYDHHYQVEPLHTRLAVTYLRALDLQSIDSIHDTSTTATEPTTTTTTTSSETSAPRSTRARRNFDASEITMQLELQQRLYRLLRESTCYNVPSLLALTQNTNLHAANVILFSKVCTNTTQHITTHHNTSHHITSQHNTSQHNTSQHNTSQHNSRLMMMTLYCLRVARSTYRSIALVGASDAGL